MSKPVFTDWFTLSGRRNRKSYFLFLLSCVPIGVVFGVAVTAALDAPDALGVPAVIAFAGMAFLLVAGWIVGAQRCRDFGWTGWAILISAIPFVGWIFPFVMLFVPGTAGPNRYGPDPLGPEDARLPVAAE